MSRKENKEKILYKNRDLYFNRMGQYSSFNVTHTRAQVFDVGMDQDVDT